MKVALKIFKERRWQLAACAMAELLEPVREAEDVAQLPDAESCAASASWDALSEDSDEWSMGEFTECLELCSTFLSKEASVGNCRSYEIKNTKMRAGLRVARVTEL